MIVLCVCAYVCQCVCIYSLEKYHWFYFIKSILGINTNYHEFCHSFFMKRKLDSPPPLLPPDTEKKVRKSGRNLAPINTIRNTIPATERGDLMRIWRAFVGVIDLYPKYPFMFHDSLKFIQTHYSLSQQLQDREPLEKEGPKTISALCRVCAVSISEHLEDWMKLPYAKNKPKQKTECSHRQRLNSVASFMYQLSCESKDSYLNNIVSCDKLSEQLIAYSSRIENQLGFNPEPLPPPTEPITNETDNKDRLDSSSSVSSKEQQVMEALGKIGSLPDAKSIGQAYEELPPTLRQWVQLTICEARKENTAMLNPSVRLLEQVQFFLRLPTPEEQAHFRLLLNLQELDLFDQTVQKIRQVQTAPIEEQLVYYNSWIHKKDRRIAAELLQLKLEPPPPKIIKPENPEEIDEVAYGTARLRFPNFCLGTHQYPVNIKYEDDQTEWQAKMPKIHLDSNGVVLLDQEIEPTPESDM